MTFWDGTPVTPADVIYSLERHKNDVTDAYYGAFVLVAAIEATGDEQVTVHFNAPDSTSARRSRAAAVPCSARRTATRQVQRSERRAADCSAPVPTSSTAGLRAARS